MKRREKKTHGATATENLFQSKKTKFLFYEIEWHTNTHKHRTEKNKKKQIVYFSV